MNYWIIGTLILSLISPISYTKSMLAGKAKPHRITRLIVWLASVAGMLGVLHSTNLAGQIFAGIFFARATYLLIMAAIYGTGGFAKLDIYCLVFGLLALVAYLTTHNGVLTISLGILADVIGYIPTFIKTYHKPDSEDPVFFSIEGLASLLGVFAVWELKADILFPLYFTLCSGLMVALIYRKKILSS
jgi:hypothetical protein